MNFILNTLIFFSISILIESKAIKVKRTATGKKWPQNIVPYAISHTYGDSDRGFITKNIQIFESSLAVDGKKCLQFVPRTTESSYVIFQDSDKCASNIGYYHGQNIIHLAKSHCIRKGIILHEIMHA